MFRLALLLVSFCGYFALLFSCKKGKAVALYPAITVSAITAAGFLAGLVHQLKAAYLLILGVGILLAAFYLFAAVFLPSYKVRLFPAFTLKSVFPLLLFAAGACLLYLYICNDRFFYAYDDFSHWGRVANVISVNQRLPIPADGLIFTSYPVGSALFIAFCSNLLGHSADAYLFAQALMLLALYSALLAAANRRPLQLIIFLALVLFMQYNISLENLCVDNLLSAAAVSGIVMCFSLEKKQLRSFLPELGCILAALTLMKNSGFFLALIIAGYAAFLCRCGLRNRKELLGALCLLLPVLMLLLWRVHTKITFPVDGKHTLSLSYYKRILSENRFDGMKTIFQIICPMLFSPKTNHVLLLLPGFALAFLLLRKSENFDRCKSIFLFSACLFVIYEIGVLLMYLVSMNTSEVLYQNGQDYYRYNGTLVAVLAAVLICLMCQLSFSLPFGGAVKKNAVLLASCAIMIFSSVFALSLRYYPIQPPEEHGSDYISSGKMMRIAREHAFPEGSSFIVLYDVPDTAGYHEFMSTYYLNTWDIIHCYDLETAEAAYAANPHKYYIDLNTSSVYLPAE